MRIAIVRKIFDPNGGGAEKVTANCARELIRRGHQVTVFSEKFERLSDCDMEWVEVPKRFSGFSFANSVRFHRNVQKKLRDRSRFDVVYSLSRTFPCDVLRVTEQLHAEWLPIGYSALQRLNPRHKAILKLEKALFLAQNVKKVVTNSELVKKQVVSRFQYPQDRIFVVRNGVDHSIFTPPAAGEKETSRKRRDFGDKNVNLLFVAGNFRIKGLEAALKAIGKLDSKLKERLRLHVVGGDDPGPFQTQIEEIGLTGDVRFHGKFREMRDFYVAADLLLYPSMYEPFGNVCLEACACGLPVLTTACNGSSELVVHGENGFVVEDSTCVDAITAHIGEFMAMSEKERCLFGERAVEATRDYTWEKHAETLESIFETVVWKRA